MAELNDEWLKELGKAAFKAAEEMLETLPKDKKYVHGRVVLTAKEAREKFRTDLPFAKKTVERIVKLKLRVAKGV